MSQSTREKWIDYTKVVACLLILIRHFFQSMVEAGLMKEGIVYLWFIHTVYLFCVPLFFFCSGYLYQKTTIVHSFVEWKHNISKKIIVLGVPYITFSSLTWIMKVLFSSSVNSRVGGYFYSLCIHPIGAYWYLYFLFFMFLVTPTMGRGNTKKERVLNVAFLGCALVAKLLVVGGITHSYFWGRLFSNEIWFVVGMYVCLHKNELTNRISIGTSSMLLAIFVIASIVVEVLKIDNSWIAFVMGIMAVLSIAALMYLTEDKSQRNIVLKSLSEYTFPIFLMHTMAAALVRIVLLKLGIFNLVVHIALGLSASIIIPIVAAIIMKKSVFLEVMLYPTKFLKKKK